jgi:hypothetical protein
MILLWASLSYPCFGEGLVWGASTRLCSNHFTGTPHTLYSTAEKLTKPGTHAASLTDPSRCLWCFLEQHLIREGCTVLHYPIAETDPILKTMGTYWQATHVVRSIKEPLRERKKCLFEVYNRGLEDGGCKCADSSNVPSFGLTMCFSFTPSSCESMAVNRLYSHFLYFLGYALDRLTFAIPSCSQPIERRFPSSFHPGGSMI